MGDGTTPETSLSAIEERNRSVASSLSLIRNNPDRNGRNLIDLEGDRLERIRPDWEDTESERKVGEGVLIKPGTPVGLGSKGYIVGEQIVGTYMGGVDSGFYGGQGYMQSGSRRRSPFVLVGVEVSGDDGGVPRKANLTVPHDMLEAVPEETAPTAPNG